MSDRDELRDLFNVDWLRDLFGRGDEEAAIGTPAAPGSPEGPGVVSLDAARRRRRQGA